MIQGHGGNIHEWAKKLNCSVNQIIDMSSNINPLGSPPQLLDYLKTHLSQIHYLPEVDSQSLIRAFAALFDKHTDQVACGTGTTEFIYLLPEILKSKKALIFGPTYADYADACIRYDVHVDYIFGKVAKSFQPTLNKNLLEEVDTVFICNPNNPTGHFIPYNQLKNWCKSYPDVRFIIDESYLYFLPEYDYETMIRCGLPNVIVLSSFSKIFAIPGLRLGFIVANPEIIQQFRKIEKPWNINIIAQLAAGFIFDNMLAVQNHIEKTAELIQAEKKYFETSLEKHEGIKTFGDFVPFMIIELPEQFKAEKLCAYMIEKKYLIRNCANFAGLNGQFIRIAYRGRNENKKALDLIVKFLKQN